MVGDEAAHLTLPGRKSWLAVLEAAQRPGSESRVLDGLASQLNFLELDEWYAFLTAGSLIRLILIILIMN